MNSLAFFVFLASDASIVNAPRPTTRIEGVSDLLLRILRIISASLLLALPKPKIFKNIFVKYIYSSAMLQIAF